MLWCKYIPWAAFWGFPQAPTDPGSTPAVIAVEQLMVVTHIAELLVPPTVTVTVGIPATPVVHAAVTSAGYPAARARPVFSYDSDDDSDSELWEVSFSYGDAVLAFGDWFENGGFNVDFRVTPLRLAIAAFVFGCLQLAFMVLFRDYKLLEKAVSSLFRGLCSGSKVLWTLLLGGSMYLTYDQLEESPACLVFLELLFYNQRHSDFVSRFFRGLFLPWDKFWDYSSIPRKAGAPWLLAEVLGDKSLLAEKDKFKPKTMTDLLVVIIIGLVQFGVAGFKFCFALLSAAWKSERLPNLLVSAFNKCELLFERIDAQLEQRGYSWLSPVKAMCITLPIAVRDCLFSVGAFLRVLVWIKLQHPCPCSGKSPLEVNPERGSNWTQRSALHALGKMSIWGMADVIMERDQLKLDIENLEPEIRKHAYKESAATIKQLAKRAISWRTSHLEMTNDYNHCRRTLDYVMNVFLHAILGLDHNGPDAQEFFRSSFLINTGEPLPNGLHYKRAPICTQSRLMPDLANKASADFSIVMANLKRGYGKKFRNTWFPRYTDLYQEQTWPFDLKRMGFQFAPFKPEKSPIHLSQRVIKIEALQEFEDFVLADRIDDWFAELPARVAKQQRMQHPFWNTGYD